MFQDASPDAELRLIDFGSGTLGAPYLGTGDPEHHTTFAGVRWQCGATTSDLVQPKDSRSV